MAVAVGQEGSKRSMVAATGMVVRGPVATAASGLPMWLEQWDKISTSAGQTVVARRMR